MPPLQQQIIWKDTGDRLDCPPLIFSWGQSNPYPSYMRCRQSDRLTLLEGDDFLKRKPLARGQESWGTKDIESEHATAPFRFFSLPPEIRQEIIKLSVIEPQPIFIKFKDHNRHAKPQRKTRSGHLIDRKEYVSPEKWKWGHSRMAILFTCRQAYAEGWPLYYGGNEFCLTPEVFKCFYHDIPARCVHQIRSIIMPFYHESLDVWRLLATLQHLQSLHFIVSKLLRTSHPHQVADCRQGVPKLPHLRRFRIDHRWISDSAGNFKRRGETARRSRVDDIFAVTEKEINEFLRSRQQKDL